MSDPLGLIPNATQTGTDAARAGGAQRTEATTAFRDVLMQEIEQVNRLQKDAEQAIEDLVAGRRDDVDAVAIAKNQADIAFQLLLQVRNKMADAYEEVKQIRV
ncbi:flagellar hook-basal body complex protein FliE [Mucisphaera calidilacus]|uniref:Flagellar hook-basal body complex protein FliE n=1 Tax=Mucisphaera calidilacus TaxID=2527982 RepID=A0A518BYZ5_9BACT|nr:flagellar hook-basal body complex protein FliE [Mucisphaera calidilacus]QDU72188.1 flagellar hook-basal body protein FliE [Mucisphaera calidilacus]